MVSAFSSVTNLDQNLGRIVPATGLLGDGQGSNLGLYYFPNGYFGILAGSPVQYALASQIVTAANSAAANVVQRVYNSGQPPQAIAITLSTPLFYDVPAVAPVVVTGSAGVASAQLILANNGDQYTTAGTSVSTVVIPDLVSATVIGNNPAGALIAATGAAANVASGDTLEGLAGANQFVTGTGGRDAVLLDGVANSLTSNGNDVVLVGGPSTIAAASGGMDNITLTAGTVLTFANQSASATDTITGAPGGIVALASTGSTSISAGAGSEYVFLDTSSGNATINANGSSTAALTFIRDAAAGTSSTLVNNLGTGGIVAVHGYSGFTVAQSPAPGGSVLSLSDGSQVTFSNVSPTALQAAVRTV